MALPSPDSYTRIHPQGPALTLREGGKSHRLGAGSGSRFLSKGFLGKGVSWPSSSKVPQHGLFAAGRLPPNPGELQWLHPLCGLPTGGPTGQLSHMASFSVTYVAGSQTVQGEGARERQAGSGQDQNQRQRRKARAWQHPRPLSNVHPPGSCPASSSLTSSSAAGGGLGLRHSSAGTSGKPLLGDIRRRTCLL